jgi:hypothetical protein
VHGPIQPEAWHYRRGTKAKVAWTAKAGVARSARHLEGHRARRVGGGAAVAGGSDGEAQRGPAEEH